MTLSRIVVSLALAAVATGCTSGTAKPLTPPPTVCERGVVTAADVSDLVAGPLAMKVVPGDPQSCQFAGANQASMTITVRPGLGDVTVETWAKGKMPVPVTAVPGVGDRAVWQDTLRELIATRRNVLCDVQTTGAAGSPEELQKRFGVLCEKIWAAR